MASTTAVMGAGAWGTALAKLLADAGGEVRLWARRPDLAAEIDASRHNPDYLPGVELPPGVRAIGDAEEALSGVTTVLLAVPAQTMRTNVEHWKSLFAEVDPGQHGQGHRVGHSDAVEPGHHRRDRC
jgi:glycerol-3-phosphate dehydrogenase (NAD(P)+)